MIAIDADRHASQKRAILDLRRLGYTTDEILSALGISRPTLWRREAEIRREREEYGHDDDD